MNKNEIRSDISKMPHLGREISTDELENKDKFEKLKNNKSPGIDGLSADFLKLFWGKTENHTTNAIIVPYIKGILSK